MTGVLLENDSREGVLAFLLVRTFLARTLPVLRAFLMAGTFQVEGTFLAVRTFVVVQTFPVADNVPSSTSGTSAFGTCAPHVAASLLFQAAALLILFAFLQVPVA